MPADVRYGSKGDILGSPPHVRFAPESRHRREHRDVRYVPIADKSKLFFCSEPASDWRKKASLCPLYARGSRREALSPRETRPWEVIRGPLSKGNCCY